MHMVPYSEIPLRGEMEDASSWRILLGKPNLSHSESTQRVYCVKQIYQHEWFHENHSNHLDYDIALVKPMEDIRANRFVRYACLPKRGCSLYLGQSCWVTGWGAHNRYMSTAGFQDQTGLVLFFLLNPNTQKRII